MDYNSRKYTEAKTTAEKILFTKKGRCYENASNSDVYLGNDSFAPGINYWYQIKSYRMNADNNVTDLNLVNSARAWIRASEGIGCPSVFVILRENGMTSFIYGTGKDVGPQCFTANISECDVERTTLIGSSYNKNGFFTGTINADNLSDAVLSSKIENYYVACILLPVTSSEISNLIAYDRGYISKLDACKSYHRIYGNASRRDEVIEIPEITQAILVLKEEVEYLQSREGSGFVRSLVRYGAATTGEYNRLTAVIQSCLRYENTAGFEPSQHFDIGKRCSGIRECIAIPTLESRSSFFNETLHPLTLQDIMSVASFCKLPKNSCNGFYVKNYSVDEDSLDAFPLTLTARGERITVGNEAYHNSEVTIPLKSLHSHTFITGATETGKTTTVMSILSKLHEKGINFTVIEAAKKEYYKMLGSIPELRIYTAGADGVDLLTNPLQPEDGILIENHVDAIVRALLAATGGDHPIPEAYKGLLKQAYSKYGWSFGMLAYTDENKPFPTFKDVFELVDSYVAEHAKYGPEVRMNLCAALSIRSETMHEGALGNLFKKNFGLKAKDFLEYPCVIELSDFSTESVTFLMNVLLFKFQSYLSKQSACDDLKRVIVLEEAHNVFKKTISEDTGRALNNDYFDRMLAEIRNSGTGMIISDQRPSIMSDAVEANTSVKIIHSLTSKHDYESIGDSAGLSEFQIRKLREFSVGECVVSIRGCHGVQHCIIEPAEIESYRNASCHICPNRFRCISDVVNHMIENSDSSLVDYHVSKIISNPYNPAVLSQNIDNMLKNLNVIASDSTKVCFLGAVLFRYGNASEQDKRIITNTYYKYLKGRKL